MIDNSKKLTTKSRSLDDLLRSHRLFDLIYSKVVPYYTGISKKKTFALELPGGSQSSRAANCLGMTRGVLGCLLYAISNIQITKHTFHIVKPTEVHQRATGRNKAEKCEIMNYVCSKYSNQIEKICTKTTRRTTYRIKFSDHTADFSKGEFEHIADAIVIGELGLERLMKS